MTVLGSAATPGAGSRVVLPSGIEQELFFAGDVHADGKCE